MEKKKDAEKGNVEQEEEEGEERRAGMMQLISILCVLRSIRKHKSKQNI